MILDTAIYGVVLLWLVGVVPAGVFTCLRGRWLIFWCGWLTGGILWFIGALVPDPDASPRARRGVAIGLAATVAAFLALGVLGARPTPVLGMNGLALQSAVGGVGTFALGPENCNRIDGVWICRLYDSQVSGTVPYRVEVGWDGCWEASRLASQGGSSPRQFSGCATLVNFVF